MDQFEIITRAQQDEPAAWEEIIQEHQQAVFRLAYLILGDSAEAEDMAQETFLRAWHSVARFDPTRPLRPWLLRIVVNLSRNRRRAAGRYWAALKRSAQKMPADDLLLEGTLDQQLQAQNLWQAIRSLKKRDQQVIYLRHFMQLPVAETAQALSVAPGTVKSRLKRALARLQSLIETEYPDLQETFSE